jgi:hypothetical protein
MVWSQKGHFRCKIKFSNDNRVGPASQLGPLVKLRVRFSRKQLTVTVAPLQGVSYRLCVTTDGYFTPVRTMW